MKLKIVPGSSRNQVVGLLGDALKIKVAAPPEKGKANKAVIQTLAAFLAIEPEQVRLLSGETSVAKVVELYGVDEAAIARRLCDFA